jgi:hypothetical protein
MIKKYKKRELYLSRLKPFIGKDLIKVIVGQRRVGKSYLLFQIMDELLNAGAKKTSILYINKELNEFSAIKNEKDLLGYIKQAEKTGKKKHIFIDEIQDIENFEKALRHLAAKGGYDIYCTGSNANLLSGELATHLSGRYVKFEVFSLSYLEFINFHQLENNKEALLKYFKYGGLPYLKNLKLEDETIGDYIKNIYDSILLKDVVSRFKIRNVNLLERLVEYLADNVGSMVSAKKISDFLKSQKINISPNVILNYISYLSSAFLIFKAQRAEVHGKKIFEVNEKYYFEDLGLRHSIIIYQPTDINKILENAVYMHLKVLGFKINIGKIGDKEIDFIAEKEGRRIYIQVAYIIADKKTKEREFGSLLAVKDNYPKYVVTMDEVGAGDYSGIKQINIRDFLSSLVF